MRRRLVTGAVTALITNLITALALASPSVGGAAAAETAPAPAHTLQVSGTGIGSYPAFSPTISRYAVTGGTETQVQVIASTSDPDGEILVDGVPHGPQAEVVVSGEAGEEISVIFDDAGGRAAHSLVLLPAEFPTLAAETAPGADLTPGLVLLTLSTFHATEAVPYFEVAVDRNGVPTYVHREEESSLDLKQQPDGSLTVQRASAAPWPQGSPLVGLDDRWQPTGEERRMVDGVVNTDPHDSILYPDGRVILLSYELRDDGSGILDSVVQESDADGNALFTWSTADLDIATESLLPEDPDFSHINSVVVMADGHWLLSFRHLSSVYKVARYDDGPHKAGEVIWQLGGRNSSFSFPDDPHAGPCAQHTASELPNGNILIFDNGGSALGDSPSLCVDPAAPATGRVDRPFTRISEYALDETAMRATLVDAYQPDGHYAYFAGGVARLPNGHRLIGWASSRKEIATELDTDGQTPLWTLRDTAPVAQRLFTYRAHIADVPDAIAPTVRLTGPDQVRVGADARMSWQCRDAGGADLATCVVPDAGVLDTSVPGTHAVHATATDHAGNTTTETLAYTVTPTFGVDAAVRLRGGAWQGVGSLASAKAQQVTTKVTSRKRKRRAQVRITNQGDVPDRFVITGKGSTKAVKVVHRIGGRTVTGTLTRAGFRAPLLAPGASVTLTLRLKHLRAARQAQAFPIRVRSTHAATARDAVRVRVRARP